MTAAGRVNGNLNLSRSIGDLKYKQTPSIPPEFQIITAEPVSCYATFFLCVIIFQYCNHN